MPFLAAQFTSIIHLFSNKFVSIAVTVIGCGVILFGLERIVSHRMSMRNQYLI